MSKQRVVKDEIWDDDWFYELDPSEKLVWLFLLTNPRGNIAGIYKLNQKWAAQAVGLDFDVFKTVLQRFVRDGKIIYEENWIGLVNFHRHVAYRNASVAQGIVRLYREGTGCPQALYSVWLTLLNSTLLYLSEGDEKSPQLKKEIKQIITMGWNKTTDDFEEGVVDFDTGEITDPIQEDREKNKELNTRKKEMVDWLIKYQNRDPIRTNRPKQIKAINRLIEMKVTGKEAQEIIMQQMDSDFWRGKSEKPDFSTVVSIIEKRGE